MFIFQQPDRKINRPFTFLLNKFHMCTSPCRFSLVCKFKSDTSKYLFGKVISIQHYTTIQWHIFLPFFRPPALIFDTISVSNTMFTELHSQFNLCLLQSEQSHFLIHHVHTIWYFISMFRYECTRGMTNTEMSSNEPGSPFFRFQFPPFNVPRAIVTSSWAADMYL